MSLTPLFAFARGADRAAALAALERDLKRGLETVERAPASPERERAIATLESATRYLRNHDASEPGPAGCDDDERCLSLVLSAREMAPSGERLASRGLLGTAPYEDADPGWFGVLWSWLTRPRAPFRSRPRGASGAISFADDAVVALAADWGTGCASSARIADAIRALDAPHAIHLGDVYYAGTEAEVRDKLVSAWPAGSVSSFTLNANHEMYSGGHGYFDVALRAPAFAAQGGFSYFAMENRHATIIGVDSAYHAQWASLYHRGALDADAQMPWLRAVGRAARSAGRKVILLSHHHGLELDGTPVEPLWSQIADALEGGPDLWYWGHVHAGAAFTPRRSGGAVVRGRCIGHGGVPYAPIARGPALAWAEDALAGDPDEPRRARNGFAVLRFASDALIEELRDEDGAVRWTERTPWRG